MRVYRECDYHVHQRPPDDEIGAAFRNRSPPVVYDDINLQRGTARVIGNAGASDLTVSWQANALWLFERTDFGNVVETTVFPTYAEGTQDFVVIESRHSRLGSFVLGEQSSGTCSVLD